MNYYTVYRIPGIIRYPSLKPMMAGNLRIMFSLWLIYILTSDTLYQLKRTESPKSLKIGKDTVLIFALKKI